MALLIFTGTGPGLQKEKRLKYTIIKKNGVGGGGRGGNSPVDQE